MEYTAKGTNTATTSGTTLTISSVTVTTNKTLMVMVGFDQSQGAPTCTWGGQTLTKVVQRLDTTSGVGAAIFVKEQVWNGRTSDVVLTWSSAITTRVASCFETDNYEIEDLEKRNIQAATTTPNTLYTDTATNYDDEGLYACHVSVGPVTDTQGTPDSGDTPVMTLGQRVGTSGASLEITLQETYGEITSAAAVRSRLTGATERTFINIICTMRGHTMLAQGITPTDIQACETKFDSLSKDFENAAWAFNPALDRWEVYEDTDMSTVIAHSNNGWA